MIFKFASQLFRLGIQALKSKISLITYTTFDYLINKADLKVAGSRFDAKHSLASITSDNQVVLWRWAMLGAWSLVD